MLEAKELTKTFPQGRRAFTAVNHVNFSLKDGEFCALVGESGSGKSTLSQLLCGLIPATSGEILLDGQPISPKRRRRDKSLCARIQLVLQNGQTALDPRFSVYDSIAEPIRNLTGLDRTAEARRIAFLMEQMELPQTLLTCKPAELSGGQQKRVCIARALAAQPKILLFDEAVSGLDVIVRKSILDLLLRLHKEQKTTCLFITHDMEVALYLASRILVMKDGEIVENRSYGGDPGCFTHPYSRLLLSAMLPESAGLPLCAAK